MTPRKRAAGVPRRRPATARRPDVPLLRRITIIEEWPLMPDDRDDRERRTDRMAEWKREATERPIDLQSLRADVDRIQKQIRATKAVTPAAKR